MSAFAALARRIPAILRQRCPICLEGRMFRSLLVMHPQCPRCGHRFEREPGFFQGAMYLSYAMGVLLFSLLVPLAVFVLAPLIGYVPALAVICLGYLAMVPALWRYSRVLWAHANAWTMRFQKSANG